MAHSSSGHPASRTRFGILGLLLSVGVALVSYRYLFPSLPIPEVVAGNAFRFPWLVLHAATASTALLLGPWQFWSKLRARRPGLHRGMGKLYVAMCLVAGGTGFVLALGASTGLVSTAGFGLLSIAWVFTTTTAWRTAMQRDFVAHREWMIRSFALTFSAVTLRIYLPILGTLPIAFDDGYRAISFLCWVPNLLVAELYLARQRRAHQPPIPSGRSKPTNSMNSRLQPIRNTIE